MSMPFNFSSILTSLAYQFPTIVVCFVGLVLVLLQMQRQPRVAMLVALGLALMLAAAIVQPLVQIVVQSVIQSSFNWQRGPQFLSLVFAVSAVLFNLLRAVGLGLIAYAAFVDRPRQHFTNPLRAQPWPPAPGPVEGKIVPGNAP